jgi:hypothetical protein
LKEVDKLQSGFSLASDVSCKISIGDQTAMAEVEINCSGRSQAIGSTTAASNLVPLYLGMHTWAALR